MSREQIISEIENYAGPHGYKNCYIGSTNDLERRLLEHKRDDENKRRAIEARRYIHLTASSEAVASDIQKHFTDRGMQGRAGSGGPIVYVIKL